VEKAEDLARGSEEFRDQSGSQDGYVNVKSSKNSTKPKIGPRTPPSSAVSTSEKAETRPPSISTTEGAKETSDNVGRSRVAVKVTILEQSALSSEVKRTLFPVIKTCES